MRLSVLFLSLLAPLSLATPSAPVVEQVPFLPAPREQVQHTGQPGFALAEGIRVDVATSYSHLGRALIRALQAAGVPVLPEEMEGDVTLRVANGLNPEGYELTVTPQGITIGVNSEAALPLVAQTLAQAMVKDSAGAPALPSMSIRDEPRFSHRGLMLDCARHPQTVDEIKKILRTMARYKLNRLHWHLTDDQGWRLEIRACPKLTQVGSHRPGSALLPANTAHDGIPVSAFYTQDEVRELVAYAHSLGIIITPEIEIPGHASAAIASYPELGNTDAPGFSPTVVTNWGVFPNVFAPKEETFRFLSTVLAEVCELFPRASYIHCGGDECPREQWQKSPSARAFMARHGMREAAEVQHYFTRFCADTLAGHGRRMVGWDEIQDAPQLPDNAIIMAWRGYMYQQVIRRAVQEGRDVICCPDTHCYLNFGHKVWAKDPFYQPLGTATDRDWQQLYSFRPIPAGLSPAQQRHIIGVQANAWSEVIPDGRKLEYMLFPRLLALAEVAWLPEERRDEADFRARLLAQYPWLDREGINFREEDGTPRRDKGE